VIDFDLLAITTTGRTGPQGEKCCRRMYTPYNFCVKNQYCQDPSLPRINVVRQNLVGQEFQQHAALPSTREVRYPIRIIDAVRVLVGASLRVFRARRALLENLALHQLLAARKQRHPRPRVAVLDKLFRGLARRLSAQS